MLPSLRDFRRPTVLLIGVAAYSLLWMHEFLTMGVTRNLHPLQSQPPSCVQLSDILFPIPLAAGDSDSSIIHENHKMLQSLLRCLERNNCHENQTKVVILASHYFRDYFYGGRTGESIWARSTTLALANLGYTFIYTPHPSYEHTMQYYRMFPDLVKLIFVDHEDSYRCFKDTRECVMSKSNPSGIPPWILVSFEFWAPSQNPLGSKWTVAPEDYGSRGTSNNTYLGYSIEESCRKQRFVPHSEREKQAYILSKYLFYFTPEWNATWTNADYDAVSDATDIKFVIASDSYAPEGNWSTPQLPSEHVNLGHIDQDKFMDTLSRSRVLIGIGTPPISPSPYDALCLGVPFINPVTEWDPENPSDMSRWKSQHDALQELGPPYVYNVFKGDTRGFVQAVKDALSNPIESYVLERMTIQAVEKRLAEILEKDWAAAAEELEKHWTSVDNMPP